MIAMVFRQAGKYWLLGFVLIFDRLVSKMTRQVSPYRGL